MASAEQTKQVCGDDRRSRCDVSQLVSSVERQRLHVILVPPHARLLGDRRQMHKQQRSTSPSTCLDIALDGIVALKYYVRSSFFNAPKFIEEATDCNAHDKLTRNWYQKLVPENLYQFLVRASCK